MRKYEQADFLQISLWCIDRNIQAPKEWGLPPTGVIVDGVAAGFLIKTDNSCGFLDCFISNPAVSKEKRSKAIDKIVTALLIEAKASGLKLLMCESKIETVKIRAVRTGFEFVGDFSSYRMEL